MPDKLILASNNSGKLAELGHLLAPLGWELRPQGDYRVPAAEETAVTFVENALIKARHASQATGLPALADDSGLAVAALYSARFAGADATDDANNRKLLSLLADVPEDQRQACFHCVLVFLRHAEDPTPLICHGRWEGRILREPRGAGGFGYDPLFQVPEAGCSAAELDRARKSQLSHRGRALRALIDALGE